MLLGTDLGDDGTAVLERLRLLHRQGYSLALLWPEGNQGPGWTKYSPAALDAVGRFMAQAAATCGRSS